AVHASPCGRTKRRINQGQAMRSTFGRLRVTQTVRPLSSRGGSLSVRTRVSPAFFQASNPPSSVCASMPSCLSQAGRALAQLFPALAHDNHALAAVVRCPAADGTVIAPQRTRHQPWIVVVDAHIDDSRRVREADLARELRNGDEG